MTGQVGTVVAFGAGVVSFLSPCVLPLIPAYVSFMTGMSLSELTGDGRRVSRILGPVLLFVAGFSVVFVAMGAGASVLGSLVSANRILLERVAGVVVIALGIVLLDVIPMPWLHGGAGVDAAHFRKFGPWASLALGVAFPFALGPCAGPVYGSILTLAVDSRSVGAGAVLLLVYSLGLALPFVAVSLLLGRLASTLAWLSRHARLIDRIAGAVLVLMGIAMVTGLFELFGTFLQTIPLLRSIG